MTILNRSGFDKEAAQADFDILQSFSALEAKTKLMICEQLFVNGQGYFKTIVRNLWPHASDADARRLEKYIRKYKP